jgi:hypothetical protein
MSADNNRRLVALTRIPPNPAVGEIGGCVLCFLYAQVSSWQYMRRYTVTGIIRKLMVAVENSSGEKNVMIIKIYSVAGNLI